MDRRWWRFLIAAAVGSSVALTGVGTGANGQENTGASLTVELTPSEAEIGPGATQPVAAIVTNSGASPVSNVKLTWRRGSGGGVTVDPPEASTSTMPGGASQAFGFGVQRSFAATKQTVIVLETTYHDDAKNVDRAVVSSLTVKAAEEPATPTAILAVDLSSAVGELAQYRSTDLKMTLTNSTPVKRIVTRVELAAPTFVSVSFSGPEKLERSGARYVLVPAASSLTGGQQAVFLFHLELSDQLEPGDAFVVASVTSKDDRGTESTTVASAKLTFSVLGESAFLNVIGIPSIYLVPGLVFAVVLFLLYKRVYPRPAAGGGAVAAVLGLDAKVVFWVLALVPCLVLPYLYPTATSLVLRAARDYRRAYGFDDILYVWTLAAALAAAVWLVFFIVPLLVRLAWHRLFIPQPGDSPRRMLWKLARRGPWTSSKRRPATYTTGNAQVVGRLLGHRDDGHVVVAPRVLIRPTYAPLTTSVDHDRPIRIALTASWYRWQKNGRLWFAGGRPIEVQAADAVQVQADEAPLVEVAADGEN